MADRTNEFFNALRLIRQAMGVDAPAAPPRRAPKSPLWEYAREVSRQLRTAADLVKRLDRLSRETGLFNDPTTEINRATAVVQSTVRTQETTVRRMEDAVEGKGPAALYQHAARQHWAEVIAVLRARLLAVTRGMQAALQRRSASLRQQQRRRQHLGQSKWVPAVEMDSPLFANPRAHPSTNGAASVSKINLPHSTTRRRGMAPPTSAAGDHATATASGTAGGASAPSTHTVGFYNPQTAASGPQRTVTVEATPLAEAQGMIQQGLSSHVARARVREARKTERMVDEIGQMFQHLAPLVQQQGDTITRIEEDIDTTASYADSARNEIVEYFRSMSTDRVIILSMFAVALLIMVFFAWWR